MCLCGTRVCVDGETLEPGMGPSRKVSSPRLSLTSICPILGRWLPQNIVGREWSDPLIYGLN